MMVARVAVTLLVVALGLPAQPAPAEPVEVGSVVLSNISGHPRRDVVTTVVPFASGAYRGEPLVMLDGPSEGAVLQVRRLGAAWPDGSWRHAVVHLPARLGAVDRQRRRIGRGTGPTPAFSFGADVAPFDLGMRVGSESAHFRAWEAVEAGHLLSAWRSRVRVPDTPVWAECVVEFPAGLDHARFWLHYGDSDPAEPAFNHDLPAIEIWCRGPSIVLRHAPDKVSGVARSGGFHRIEVEPGSRWKDGESQALTGVLLFGEVDSTARAEAEWPLFAVSDSWAASGAFGPWGYVPPLPPGETATSVLARAVADWQAHEADPWGPPVLGLLADPGSTGDQPDFSAAVLTAAARGYPERLHVAQRSVLRDACRDTHRRAVDGSPVPLGRIADVLLWSGVPDPRISPNLLGKPKSIARGRGHRTWHGRDRQHWTCSYLATHALLTADRWALAECEHLAELWLGEMRISSPSPILNSAGNARATGRTLHSGVMLYLVTGRDDLRRRILARVDVVEREWAGRGTAPVRPLHVSDPDPRILGGEHAFWSPWMEAIGVRGLDAVAIALGDATAGRLARDAGISVMEHGVWTEAGALGVGYAVAWDRENPGAPSTIRAHSTGFNPWAAAAAVVVLRRAGQSETEARDRAAALLATVGDDWRAWEWKAVR